jgi:hypothetical protein
VRCWFSGKGKDRTGGVGSGAWSSLEPPPIHCIEPTRAPLSSASNSTGVSANLGLLAPLCTIASTGFDYNEHKRGITPVLFDSSYRIALLVRDALLDIFF